MLGFVVLLILMNGTLKAILIGLLRLLALGVGATVLILVVAAIRYWFYGNGDSSLNEENLNTINIPQHQDIPQRIFFWLGKFEYSEDPNKMSKLSKSSVYFRCMQYEKMIEAGRITNFKDIHELQHGYTELISFIETRKL